MKLAIFRLTKNIFFEVRTEYDLNDRRWVIEYGVENPPSDSGNRKK